MTSTPSIKIYRVANGGRNRLGPETGKLETEGQLSARSQAWQFTHKQETGLEKSE
jgi:hypothetical protein